MPGLQAGSPFGDVQEGTNQCFSHTSMFLSLPSSLPFSQKINKNKNLKKMKLINPYMVGLARFFLLDSNPFCFCYFVHFTNNNDNSKQCARHCPKPFIHINYFYLHNYPMI